MLIPDALRRALENMLIVRTSRRGAFSLGMEGLELPHLLCAVQEETPDLRDVMNVLHVVHAGNEAKITEELLRHPRIVEEIRAEHVPHVAVVPYVNRPGIERVSDERGWNLFAPSAALVHECEEKESAYAFLSAACPEALIPAEVKEFSSCRWERGSKGYAVQRVGKIYMGGKGTVFVRTEDDFHALEVPPGERVKISPFIEGPSLNINACVFGEGTVTTDVSLQVIGPPACTVSPAVYCGNDWEAARDLPKQIHETVHALTRRIGDALSARGYRGWFGMDLLVDSETHRVYVIEMNPRLQGSTSLLTITQYLQGLMPLFLLHLAAHLSIAFPKKPDTYSGEYRGRAGGAHIIVRTGDGRERYRAVCPTGQYVLEGDTWAHRSGDVRFGGLGSADVVVHGVPPLFQELPPHDRIATIQSPQQVLVGEDSHTLQPSMQKLITILRGMFVPA